MTDKTKPLLPCAHCGASVFQRDSHTGFHTTWIVCEGCGIRTRQCQGSENPADEWNTRADRPVSDHEALARVRQWFLDRVNGAGESAGDLAALRTIEDIVSRADRPVYGDMKVVRDALEGARSELWDDWHSGMSREQFNAHPTIRDIDAGIAALSSIDVYKFYKAMLPAAQSSGVADGWQLVQKNLPLDARLAGMKAWDAHMKERKGNVTWPEMMDVVFKAMLAAAPKADTKTGGE